MVDPSPATPHTRQASTHHAAAHHTQASAAGDAAASASGAADLVLYRRMAEVKRLEQMLAIEDLMYVCILEKFQVGSAAGFQDFLLGVVQGAGRRGRGAAARLPGCLAARLVVARLVLAGCGVCGWPAVLMCGAVPWLPRGCLPACPPLGLLLLPCRRLVWTCCRGWSRLRKAPPRCVR